MRSKLSHASISLQIDTHVYGPGYRLPLDDARDSPPVAAASHRLLIGAPSRCASTAALSHLSLPGLHLLVYDCLLLLSMMFLIV